jgi:hypothetical protein
MAIVPLLPKPKIQDWPHQSEVGLHGVTDVDYQRNLCENYYDASDFGTPSPLGHALVFVNRLEQYLLDLQSKNSRLRFAETFDIWSLFLKGIYLGLVTFREVKLDELKEIGQILLREFEAFEGYRFQFLMYSGLVIGFNYPGVGFVPSTRVKPETLAALKEAVQAKDVEKASEYFAGWVHTFDEKDQGNLPFYTLAYRLVSLWNPDAPGTLPRDPDRLFGAGPTLYLGGGGLAADISKPRLPLYIGTPIVCEHCGFDITTETGQLDIAHPDDCRCPSCGTKQNWLEEYAKWIQFDEPRRSYLIYAFADSPIRRLPYSKYITYEGDGIVIQTGKFALKVRGLILTEEALKCTRLIFFRDGDRRYEPTLPIRGEYYGLVSLADNRRPVQDRISGDYVVFLKAEGWDTLITIRYAKKEVQEEEALLLSWPSFDLPGWSVYFYLLESTSQMNKAGIALRILDTHSAPKLLEGNRGQLTQPFEAFEVVFIRDGKVERQAGIYKTARVAQSRGEAPVTLSLDFGTSSSSMWYRIGDGEPQIIRFTDFTETVIGNQTLSDRCVESSSWLPTYKLDDEDTVRALYLKGLDSKDGVPPDPREIIDKMNYFLPSEMVIMPPVSADMLSRPLSGFRILHGYVSAPQGEVIYELKTLDVKGDPEGRFTYEQAVSRYLELFLVLALASIIKDEPRAGYLKVRASFPRAFSPDKLRTYLTCLDRVLKSIGKLTGFPSNTQHYVDESRAAAFSLKVPEGLTLVVDMGGGTTDVGIFEWQQGVLKPIFIDSLLYGGNAFLRLLASEHEADLFPKPTEPVDQKRRLLWLLREIRLRGFESVVQTQYRGNAHSRKVMLDLLLRFYTPITHFITRLFEAISIHRSEPDKDYRNEAITFYLVGNGWSLADAVPVQAETYRAGFRDVFRFLLETEGFTNLTPAREPSFDGRTARWPGPKAAIGYGTIMAEERDLFRDIDAVCQNVDGIRSVVGLDVRYSDGSGKSQEIPWHRAVPHALEAAHLRPVLSGIPFDGQTGKFPEKWRFIQFEKGAEVQALERECEKDIVNIEKPFVGRSVLVRFLERIYLEQLHRARRI